MTEHLFNRVLAGKDQLAPVWSRYCIAWECVGDDCVRLTVPDPNWLAMALAGGFLPPVDAYLRDNARRDRWIAENPGKALEFTWEHVGGAEHPYVAPIGPMTEEQAVEYLIMKDLPASVWSDSSANRQRLKIVRIETITADIAFRDAWKLAA